MDDQEIVTKTRAVGKGASNSQKRPEAKLIKRNNGRSETEQQGSNDTTDTVYPSSSSYTTAEEGPTSRSNQFPNGTSSASKALSSNDNYSNTELHSRISYLEDVLAGKEAALIAVTQELDAIREMSCIDASMGPLVSGFDADFKASIAEYNRKLQEHAAALCQRDEMIQKLAISLKQSVKDREDLKNEAGRLTEQVHTLQSQLHAVGQQVQQPQTKLMEALQEKDAQLLKKSEELSQCKAQSSKEVQFLMSSLELLQQRAARSASTSPPAVTQRDEVSLKLSKELNELSARYEADKTQLSKQLGEARRSESLLRSQLAAAQKECEKLNLDISSLKLAHDTQLSVHEGTFVTQSAHEEQLNKKLDEREQRVIELENELESLQLLLNEKQLECSRQGDKILRLQDQANGFTSEITTYHQTLEQYKNQIDDRQMKYTEDLALKDASHCAEIALLNGRISELQEAHSRQLHDMHQDLNRMKQKQMEELATMQLSHENEVNTSKRDVEKFRAELREKNNLVLLQDQQLSEEKKWSRTYSQQVQELGEKLNREELNNEEYRGKIESLEQQLLGIDQACTLYQPQIENLLRQLKEERQKSTDLIKQLEDVHKQLEAEQERCKVYSASIETANTSIRDLQRENAEIKIKASELEKTAHQRLKTEEQKNDSLKGEIVNLGEQLKEEQIKSASYKSELEGLNQKIKAYSTLDNNFKEVKHLLENERALVSQCRCEIDALNKHLGDQKLKFNEEVERLKTQIQGNQISKDHFEKESGDLKRQLVVMKQAHLEEKWDLEKQVNDLSKSVEQCKCLKGHSESLNEIVVHSPNAESQPKEQASVSFEQLNTLEVKLKMLSDANMHLKEERERTETELNNVKELSAISKEQFDKTLSKVQEELAKKENDIIKLQEQHSEMLLQKKEVNERVNKLLSAKAQLEKEVISVTENYNEQVSSLKKRVVDLEDNLKASCKIVDDNTAELLVKKCHTDTSSLQSSPTDNNLCKTVSEDSSKDSDIISHWAEQCADLEKINEKLRCDVSELRAKLNDAETKISLSEQAAKLQEELIKVKEEHRLALESMCASHEAEVCRLRVLSEQNSTDSSDTNETALTVLRRDLEEKHKKQMEELRTYFEQKCADFEKHYSEEVFSQHSRKLSDCSSASESELVSEMYYAGPGSSSCSGTAATPHFCDMLGESSFKEFEENTKAVDLEKLFVNNREKIEAMRLALESRHQGELEAQKELYEAKLQDLLQNMNESHSLELKLHSKRLKEMQDLENLLKDKLSESEKEISVLREELTTLKETKVLEPCDVKVSESQLNVNRSFSELESELQSMANTLKRKESESSAQIASLKIKLRQNLEVTSKLEKDMSNLRSKYDLDTQSLSATINDKIKTIEEMNLKIRELSTKLLEYDALQKQFENELNAKCSQLKTDFDNSLKEKNEEYNRKMNKLKDELGTKHVADIQKQTLINEQVLKEKVHDLVEKKKRELEAEYSEYLEFVKKCADDTKMQLLKHHEDEKKQLHEKYGNEITELKKSQQTNHVSGRNIASSQSSLQVTLSNEGLIKESAVSSCLQELLKLSAELPSEQQQHLEKIILKICREQVLQQQKLHQELEFRLESVQKECERRFHLQLEEARADIVKALEQQIQQLLDDSTDTVDKPVELQQLEKKFAHKYQLKLSTMQSEHEAKISMLLSKHAAQLSAARNKNQKNNGIITSEDLEKLYKERDCLRNVAATLRDVVAELVRYFMSWEDDFNNTLMDELVKLESAKENDILSITHQDDCVVLEQSSNVSERDCTTSDDEIPVIVATPAKGRRPSSFVKRVHFAPDVSGILSLLDDGSLLDGIGLDCSMRDASLNFQEELDRCLTRLRSDSAALYALSKPALSSTSSKPQCIPLSSEVNSGEKLSEKLAEALLNAEKLQKEKEELQNQIYNLQEEQKVFEAELQANRLRLDTFEQEARHQAELVAEGYGEGERSITCDVPSSPRATTVEELQTKARSLLLGDSNIEEVSGVVSPNTSQLLPHVVEELCRDWERLAEDSRHKQEDLQQQVEAADKQLRASRTFMDEQAAEREQERDEFVQEIKRLQELLRDKDRDRTSHQQMNHEVESLENQLKEAQLTIQEAQEKFEKLQAEHKQAVEKIWTLRDIISDLEVQVASKAEEAASVSAQNTALQQMVEQQGRTQLELAQEMEELQLCSNSGKLAEQISQLEEQLKKHQMLAEQFGDPNVIEQMKNQLRDLGMALELHTRELECANASNNLPASPCLSSPSEDVSIRETLWAMRSAKENKDGSVALPLYEMSILMEQWQKHARADDAVLRKIRDIDLQLDDTHAEKDALATRLQEQMLLSSSLQSKLDEYRCKADVKLSQATTEMQGQIEDLRVEIHNYDETLESREKQIENLRMSLHRAENELRTRDADIRKSAEAERNATAQLQMQVSKLSADNKKLQAMLSEKNAMHVTLPALVDSMLEEKNADIDRLERQVHQLSKQMELSSHYVATPSTTLEFEYCESEKVRAHVELSPVLHLRRSVNLSPINESVLQKSDIRPEEPSVFLGAEQMSLENDNPVTLPEIEVSLKPLPLEETTAQTHQHLSNESVSEILSTSTDTFNTSSLSSCEKRVTALEEELEEKNKLLASYMEQINESAVIISEMKEKCQHLMDCEKKLVDMANLEKELLTIKEKLAITSLDKYNENEALQNLCRLKDEEINHLKEELNAVVAQNSNNIVNAETSNKTDHSTDQSTQNHTELEAKESEIQRLKDEVGATQTILANLQRKVQEAKQIARSPNRSSPEKNQALRVVQNELETAKQEIFELKDLCKSIRSEVEAEFIQKHSQFEMMLNREQEAKKSLLETLEKIQQDKTEQQKSQQENDKTIVLKLENELKQANEKLTQKFEENDKLKTELSQINMECVALKQQLSTPVREVTSLTNKLESEKKFADTLKEELLLFKNKASSSDVECQSLKEQVRVLEKMLDTEKKTSQTVRESEILLKEISHLKKEMESLLQERNSHKDIIDELSHKNAVLAEELTDVGKELSDMKQIIAQTREVKTEVQRELQLKQSTLDQLESQKDKYMGQLFSLRDALNNIYSNINDFSGLTEEDLSVVHNLQRELSLRKHRGEGDGPWNKLSVTEIDIHEIRPLNSPEPESLNDLTDLVQHEVDVSVQLDQSLLQTINPVENRKVSVAEKIKERGEQEVSGRSENVSEIQSQTVRMDGHEAQNRICQLEMELSQMKSSVQQLHTKLEAERAQYCTLQQQDCILIEQMRVKLHDALDGQARLQMQLQSEISKKHSFYSATNDFNLSKQLSAKSNDKLQEQYDAAKSELVKLQQEKEASEKHLKRLLEAEIQWSRRRALMEEKHRRHVDQLQSLHAETQQECSMLRQELSAVNQKLQLAQEESAKDLDTQLKNHTPFVERLKNMNAFLEEHIEENVRMANEMEKLTDEHRKLRARIAQLEGQLADKRSNESFEDANLRFAAERAEWESEQKALLLALNEAKQKQLLLPDSDVEERVSHLFGRYLRMQSYRKALVWQKRYLLSVISGLNESKTLAASHLSYFGGKAKEKPCTSHQKFRSAVMVIIAIQRMRYMVERWLRGKRIGCGVVVQQTLSQYTLTSGKQTLFPPTRVPTDEMRSGVSQSPPTLERPRQPRSQPSEHSQLPRYAMTNRGLGSSTLSECVTNFHLVQQRFDAILSNPPK